jgi:hypothetical protein
MQQLETSSVNPPQHPQVDTFKDAERARLHNKQASKSYVPYTAAVQSSANHGWSSSMHAQATLSSTDALFRHSDDWISVRTPYAAELFGNMKHPSVRFGAYIAMPPKPPPKTVVILFLLPLPLLFKLFIPNKVAAIVGVCKLLSRSVSRPMTTHAAATLGFHFRFHFSSAAESQGI